MLAFTPDVEAAYRWFHATHELTNADGRVWWRQTSLPQAGGAGDQDARVMAEIDYLVTLTNGLLAARQAKARRTAAKAKAKT